MIIHCIELFLKSGQIYPCAVAPERIWKWGTRGHRSKAKVGAPNPPIRREAPEKNLLVVPLHFFGSKSTISRFG